MVGFIRKKRHQSQGDGLDLSAVVSRDLALGLVRRGQLEVLYRLPIEFGGSDVPENVVYVPVGTNAAKRSIDLDVIRPLLADGRVAQYSATPRYSGDSFVPAAITVAASGVESFTTTLNIWGDAQVQS